MEILAVSVPVGLHQQQATGIRPAHLFPPFLSLPRFTDSTDSVVTSFNSDLNFLFLAKTNEKINTHTYTFQPPSAAVALRRDSSLPLSLSLSSLALVCETVLRLCLNVAGCYTVEH